MSHKEARQFVTTLQKLSYDSLAILSAYCIQRMVWLEKHEKPKRP